MSPVLLPVTRPALGAGGYAPEQTAGPAPPLPSLLRHYIRITVWLPCMLLALVLLLGTMQYYHAQTQQEKQWMLHSERAMLALSELVTHIHDLTSFMAEHLLEQGSLEIGDVAALLQTYVPHHDPYRTYMPWTLFDFIDPEHMLRANSVQGVLSRAYRVPAEEHRWIMASKGAPLTLQFGSPRLGIVSKIPVIPVGMAVQHPTLGYMGMLATGMRVDKLRSLLRHHLAPTMQGMLLDQEGHVMTATMPLSSDAMAAITKDYPAAVLHHAPLTLGAYAYHHTHAVPGTPYTIWVGDAARQGLLYFITSSLPIFGAILLVGVLCLGLLYYIYRQMVAPIAGLVHVCEMIRQGEEEPVFPPVYHAEIQLLANQIHKLAEYTAILRRTQQTLHQATDSIKQSYQASLQSNAEKASIVAQFADEISVPVSVVAEHAAYIAQNIARAYPQHALISTWHDISQTAQLIHTLLMDLATYAASPSGDMQYEWVISALQPIIDDAVRVMQYYASVHSIELSCDDATDMVAELDPLRLRQMLISLLRHAITLSPPWTEIHLHVYPARDASRYHIRIHTTRLEGPEPAETPAGGACQHPPDQRDTARKMLHASLAEYLLHLHHGEFVEMTYDGMYTVIVCELPCKQPCQQPTTS